MSDHPRVPAFVPHAPPSRRASNLLAVVAILLSTVAVALVSVLVPVLLQVLLIGCAAVCLHRAMCWMLGR